MWAKKAKHRPELLLMTASSTNNGLACAGDSLLWFGGF